MIHISVENAVRDLRKEFKDLTNAEFNKGTARAINHTLGKVKTASSKEIRKTYNILARDLSKALSVRRANQTMLTGYVIAEGRPLSLKRFNPRQTRSGVSLVIKKGSRVEVSSAFIATMSSGHQGVFARGRYQGKDFAFRHNRIKKAGGYKNVGGRFQPINNDLNVNELTTVSVPRAFANQQIIGILKQQIESEFPKRLVHELMRMR